MSDADNSRTLTTGTRFSEARQAQNLTTADVARQLKLYVRQVEALEAGRYHELPGPIFVRGFIRNYARLLKLDPEELLHAAAGSLPQPAPRPETPPSRGIPFPSEPKRRWPQYAAAAVAIVGLLAVYEFFYNDATQTVVTQPEAEVPIPQTPQAESQPSAQPTESPRAGQPAVTPAASAPIARHAPTASSAPAPMKQVGVADPDKREVRLVFDEESWVEIRDRDDNTIFSQLVPAGTSRRVSGLPPLSVIVGNAHGVRMTYNGRSIDLGRHTTTDVARLTLE